MGYGLDLFVGASSIDEEFLCSICEEVLKHPTMIQDCQHIFCTLCIKTWMNSSSSCPIDRTVISDEKLGAPFRAYMNMYNRLVLKCDFVGCGMLSNLGDIEQHVKSCQFNPDAIGPCDANCGAVLKIKELPNHDCMKYLKAEVEKKNLELLELKQDLELKLAMLEIKDRDYLVMEETKCKEVDSLKKEIEKLKKESKKVLNCEDAVSQSTFSFTTSNSYLLKIQNFYIDAKERQSKFDTLSNFCAKISKSKVLILCNTYTNLGYLSIKLQGLILFTILGSFNQQNKEFVMGTFQSSGVPCFLITTTDNLTSPKFIDKLHKVDSLVIINYDVPIIPQDYVNRLVYFRDSIQLRRGSGTVINVATKSDQSILKETERFCGIQIPEMPLDLQSAF